MKKKKNEQKIPDIKAGDHVVYDGAEWEVVELYGGKKYAVIFGEAGRFSVKTESLKVCEE